MSLDKKVIKDFVAAVNKKEETKTPTILTGTVHREGGTVFVKIDGSESLTPVSTVINVENGERVTLTIENHKAMITGNLSSPAARGNEVEDLKEVVADKVNTAELDAITAKVGEIDGDVANFKETTTDKLTAQDAKIKKIDGDVANFKETTTEKLTAQDAKIKKIDGDVASFKETTTEKLNANEAHIKKIDGDVASFKETTTEKFKANEADIENLKTGKISAEDADLKYANIDFSNIGKTAMEYFYAQSGLDKDVKIGDATITGELVGVTISGDLLKGNTVVADKLVIKGSDGLYYKLNTDGMSVEKEQTDYNSLNGQVIRAKSITATKIDVEDLVAFGATIGGFKIGQDSIYSGVKESVGNTTRGIYMDNDGQFVFGDANQYVKFYKISEGKYKLAIAVEDLYIGSANVADAISDAKNTADNAASVASSAKSTAESASSAASTANSTANAAKSTAEGASKTASDAASTASAANQTAANAKSTADQAKSEADTANTNITAITKRVAEAETSISKNKDEIALRAKKTEVTEAINNSKTETDASIKVLSDKITQQVSTTDDLGKRMSKVEQDSSSWSVTLETANAAKSAADNAQSTASTANSTANSAKSTAESAASTANQANSTASSAKSTADNAKTDVDNMTVGGRNLLKGSHRTEQTYSYPTSNYQDYGIWITTTALNGDTYTLSFWAKSTVAGDVIRVHFYNPSNIISVKGNQGQVSGANDGQCDFTLSTTLTKYWVTYKIPKGGNSPRNVIIPRMGPSVGVMGKGTITIKWEKVEEGNKATDWSPAPEDVDASISEAAKTATNYMKFDNSGLTVGDLTKNTLGRNVNIDSSSVNIRNGTNVLAQFAESLIEIGKNTSTATISFLGGIVKLIGEKQTIEGTTFYDAHLLSTNMMTLGTGSTDPSSDKINSLISMNGMSGEREVLASVTDRYGHSTLTLIDSSASLYSDGDAGYSSVDVICNNNTSQVELRTNGSNGNRALINYSHAIQYWNNNTLLANYNGNTPCLWDGFQYPNEKTDLILSAPISQQPHGIVIMFALWNDNNGGATNNFCASYFVPKTCLDYWHHVPVFWEDMWRCGIKSIYVENTRIKGSTHNYHNGTGSATNIAYTSSWFVLRRVYGI